MVNLSVVPFYRAPFGLQPPTAASRRLAGYPPATNFSRPTLLRDTDFIGAAGGITLEGPEVPPSLPEVGRRRLQQLGAAVLPSDAAPDAARGLPTSAAAGGTISASGSHRLSSVGRLSGRGKLSGASNASLTGAGAASSSHGATSNGASSGVSGAGPASVAGPVIRTTTLSSSEPDANGSATSSDNASSSNTSAAAGAGVGAAAGPFGPVVGFAGMDAPPSGTMGLAVGRRHAVQVAGGVMSVFSLGASGAKSTTVRTVSLASFFAGAAPSCAGVHDGAAAYDKHADRFVVAASCGSFGRVLVAVSATPSAAGTWFMFGLIADAVGTALECRAPKEQAMADYPQLGYNKDTLLVSYYSYCPSRPSIAGASFIALPKYKAYQGAPSMYYAAYTSAEVAAAAGLPGGAAAVRQLQPVVPASAGDVEEGVAYLVADVSLAVQGAARAGGDGGRPTGGARGSPGVGGRSGARQQASATRVAAGRFGCRYPG
jgi:hypothetical protein